MGRINYDRVSRVALNGHYQSRICSSSSINNATIATMHVCQVHFMSSSGEYNQSAYSLGYNTLEFRRTLQ